jgi:hypothetical protein
VLTKTNGQVLIKEVLYSLSRSACVVSVRPSNVLPIKGQVSSRAVDNDKAITRVLATLV